MEIYLMQHGPNLSKDVDPEEALSPEGETQIAIAGRAMRRMGLHVDLIIASTKKRSWQTAAIVAKELGLPPENIVRTDLVKPLAPPEETVRFLTQYASEKSVLVTGHLPSLAEVASALLTAGSKASIHFERGGVVRIDVDSLPTHEGRLRWYLTPQHLALIAG
jgi:phosphohistidine phosphatase